MRRNAWCSGFWLKGGVILLTLITEFTYWLDLCRSGSNGQTLSGLINVWVDEVSPGPHRRTARSMCVGVLLHVCVRFSVYVAVNVWGRVDVFSLIPGHRLSSCASEGAKADVWFLRLRSAVSLRHSWVFRVRVLMGCMWRDSSCVH